MKKILIIGELYSSNLGDGVICNNVKDIIEKNIKNTSISLMDVYGKNDYNDNGNTRKNYFKILIRKYIPLDYIIHLTRYKSLKKKYIINENKIKKAMNKKYDLVVFAGGQLFLDTFCLPIMEITQILSKNKTPIIFNGCGYGKIYNKKLKKKLKEILNNQNVKYISCRDSVDIINGEYLTEEKKATQTYDSALWTTETYKISKKDSNIVGLGVMTVGSYSEAYIINTWKNIINELNKRKIKWQLFCNGNSKDYELCEKIINILKLDAKQYLSERPRKDAELVETISKYKSIISYRLHSHIIATSLDIPSVGFEWNEKIRSFFKNIHKEDRCFKINSNKEKVVNKLIVAQEEGYDKDIIENQKKYLKEKLINQINTIINNE